jgi:hypothetical protein
MNALADTDPPKPVDHTWFSQAALDVTAERRRQIEAEGWTPDHDDSHGDHSMSIAAACYALSDTPGIQVATVNLPQLWRWTGWSEQWFKPKDRRRNLIRASALILAEIERLDRASSSAAASGVPTPPPASDVDLLRRALTALDELAGDVNGFGPVDYPVEIATIEALRTRLAPHVYGVPTAHTDHPLRHYDRTCPACNAGDGAERRVEGFIEKRRAARASNAGVPTGKVGNG